MGKILSSNNISFDTLKDNKDFLKFILNDITSCVLLLDKDMMLYAFNDPLKNIFSNRPDEHLLYQRCGEAIGCAFTVEEMRDCGKTSKCTTCELRESALLAYVNRKNVYKGKLAREFYKTDSSKALKYLQFSTRAFYYNQEYYLILIISDITPLAELPDSFK